MEEIVVALRSGDVDHIKRVYQKREIRYFLDDIKNSGDVKVHLSHLEEVCRICGGMAPLVMDPHGALFKAVYDILYYFEKALEKAFSEVEDSVHEEEQLWNTLISITVLTLDSKSNLLIHAFVGICTEEKYMCYQEMSVEQLVRVLKSVLGALPRVVVNLPKKESPSVTVKYNVLVFHCFNNALEQRDASSIEPEVLAVITDIMDSTQKMVMKTPYENGKKGNYNVYGNLILSCAGQLWFQNVDSCLAMMSVIENLSRANVDENITLMVSNCLRIISENRSSSIDDNSMQKQINAFIADENTDPLGSVFDILIKSYPHSPEVTHRNLASLVGCLKVVAVHKSIKLVQLMKEVARANPHVYNRDIIEDVFQALSLPALTFLLLEVLAKVCEHDPQRIRIQGLISLVSSNPVYMQTVCDMLIKIGCNQKSTGGEAMEIFAWLIPQCLNPARSSSHLTMLSCVRVIGQVHKKELMQFKSLFEAMQRDPVLKDVTTQILDFLENRSLAGVSQKVEEQGTKLENVSNDLTETSEQVKQVKTTVTKQTEDIGNLTTDLKDQQEQVKVIKAELAEAMVDIERIDRKTVDTTPKWSHDVAKLLNVECPSDWRLLAKRLGYTNDDLRSWASHDSPCMTVLVEWFATHKSSEATRAVYVMLKEMNRNDAAEYIAKAMKDAGEMVPEDEPLDLDNPPSVFISYQWGVQEKAKILKDYLTDAGFNCWMDIGQMGGGDKLYEKIDAGIRAAKLVICLVTEKYAKSPNCNKEVNLSVSLSKPIIPLLMEKMAWPPAGSMGPIFGEYLFIRFFQRENEKKEGIYWPEAKMEELLMQMRYSVEPEARFITKKMDDWWLVKTGRRIKGEKEVENSTPTNPDIFISYQWGKQKEVTEFYQRLTSLGYVCWLDIHQMGGGDSLYDKIDRGLRGCKVVVSCVTDKYSLSLNCRREISLADALKKPVIPLLLESMSWPPAGPMSMPLSQLQYIDYTKQTSLITGKEFSLLLVLLSQYGVVKKGEVGKNVSSLATTMKAIDKFKGRKKEQSSQACVIL